MRRLPRFAPASVLLALLLATAAAIPFVGSLGAGFLNWDDPEYVTANPHLTETGGLAAIWTSLESPAPLPLTFTSFWLDQRLWGGAPAGFHFTNLWLHALAALLLFRFLRALGLPGALAAAVALLWAVHPTQAASVAWVAERKNVLSGVFYFAALWAWVAASREGGWKRVGVLWACTAAALLSKTTAVTLPVAFLLLERFGPDRTGAARRARGDGAGRGDGAACGDVAGGGDGAACGDGAGRGDGAARAVADRGGNARLAGRSGWALRIVPPAILALLAAGVTMVRESAPSALPDPAWIDRVLIFGRAIGFYAGKLLVPSGLSPLYPRWDVEGARGPGLLAWACLLGVLAAIAVLRRRRPAAVPWTVGFGVLQFFVALLPTSGLVAWGWTEKSFVSDHFLYLPAWGFWLAVLTALDAAVAAVRRRASDTRAVPLAAVAFGFLLAPLTALQVGHWRDTGTFWNHVLARDPGSWIGYTNRGQWHAAEGRDAEALADLREAIGLAPEHPGAWFNLGFVLDRTGRREEAVAAYQAAVRLAPIDAAAWNNLGVLYLRLGRAAEARRALEAAATLDPSDPGPPRNLRILEAMERTADPAQSDP